jgi:hypothetical protein
LLFSFVFITSLTNVINDSTAELFFIHFFYPFLYNIFQHFLSLYLFILSVLCSLFSISTLSFIIWIVFVHTNDEEICFANLWNYDERVSMEEWTQISKIRRRWNYWIFFSYIFSFCYLKNAWLLTFFLCWNHHHHHYIMIII